MENYLVVQPLRHSGTVYSVGDEISLAKDSADILLALSEPVIEKISSNSPRQTPGNEDSQTKASEVEESAADDDHDELLNLNTASAEEISEALSHINLSRAELIVSKRTELASFSSFDEVPYLRDDHKSLVTL